MLGIGIGAGTPAGSVTASGTGTNNTVAKFTGSSTLANSSITDNGTNIALGVPVNSYNAVALVGQGLPIIVADANLATQGFAVFNTGSTVNLLAAAPAGTYRISFYIVITTTFVTNTSVTFTISWTDDQGARSVVTTLGAPTLTAGTTAQVSQLIRSTGATAISYKPGVTGTNASAGAASFSVVLEQLI